MGGVHTLPTLFKVDMNFGDFKKVVAGYMQRSANVFSPSTVDLLAHAINAARRSAELKTDFELCKARGQLTVSLTTGASLDNMKVEGTSTALSVKTLLKAYMPLYDATAESFPVEIISRSKHVERVQRYYSGQIQEVDGKQLIPAASCSRYQIVRFGNDVYLSPADVDSYGGNTSIVVKFDVIKWLADYSLDADTDFLLTHCDTWMLFQTVWQLNMFLKEDARVPVSQAAMDRAWADVINWNSTLLQNSSDDANLD